MLNYILADYKRITFRIPRLIALALFEIAFFLIVLNKAGKAFGAYNSVSFITDCDTFFGLVFLLTMSIIDFVQTFTNDFKCKTIQVAVGIGISRLKVVICKLVQLMLVLITDLIISFAVFGILALVTGTPIEGHQLADVLFKMMGTVLLAGCSCALTMPLVFFSQNMILPMLVYFMFFSGLVSNVFHWISRSAPEFIVRLQLERFTHDSYIGLISANAVLGRFQLYPYIGAVIYFALGIFLTWLVFRRMELEL